MTIKKHVEVKFSYKKYPELSKYIDRIGAEQLNFRKFMVKQYVGHYYTEKSTIKINDDGGIVCYDREYAPTKEEAELIQAELATAMAAWPRSINVKNIESLLKVCGGKREDLAEFYSRKTNDIIFVQQKVVHKNGTKNYLPWAFFSDGVWRQMEPDGSLPFYKPKQRTKVCASIMVHEGAKAARYADWLVNSRDKAAVKLRAQHPWAEELAQYEHWGIIGGAKAPQRADYNELREENPVQLVYICDNDWAGTNVLEKFSRFWLQTLKGVFFDRRWPQGWDLADEFTIGNCPKLFTKAGRYIGPSLGSLMFPATFATRTIANKQGKPTQVVTEKFLEEWLHCITPEVFIHKDFPNQEYAPSEFNNKVSPFSDSLNTGLLVQKNLAHKTVALAYAPDRIQGLCMDATGKQMINTHVGSEVLPEKGDCTPWVKYIEHLLPDKEDRLQALRWVCTLMSHPEIKMQYSMLMISENQGVGKTTLGQDILAPIIGRGNVSYPNEADIVESTFNDWCAQKRLCIVNEIYAGHSSKAYDRLKSVTTDKSIWVNKKYQKAYVMENWAHVFACSNSFRALKMDDDDRRWIIPKISENIMPRAWWAAFHTWLDEDGGLGKILHWSNEFCAKHGHVQPGEVAPWSKAKGQVIEESMSRGLLLVASILERIEQQLGPGEMVYVTDMQLVQLIKDKLYNGQHNQYLERPLTIRRFARTKGWQESADYTQSGALGALGGRAKLLYIGVKGKPMNPQKLLDEGKKPFDINGLLEI